MDVLGLFRLFVVFQTSSLNITEGNSVFKFEPFVLHIQCRMLEDAQAMVSVSSGLLTVTYIHLLLQQKEREAMQYYHISYNRENIGTCTCRN